MKAHGNCKKLNGPHGCKKTQSHKNDASEAQTKLHICGGCHKKDYAKLAHHCHDCGKGSFSSFFRDW